MNLDDERFFAFSSDRKTKQQASLWKLIASSDDSLKLCSRRFSLSFFFMEKRSEIELKSRVSESIRDLHQFTILSAMK